MALKAAEIRAFPALVSAYRKTDEKGLYLELRPNGAKRWFFKYRVLGSEKRLTLGDWPEVSLVQARELRDEARRAVREGGDPRRGRWRPGGRMRPLPPMRSVDMSMLPRPATKRGAT
ncbi:Arm DNA-binding domain-containing protein [Sphingobium yanoikuyae]|uniref:Arm DNA-binding domain-containing protein n=1 Tax=Sphingobium yanoikuyae TaxID=13690 RepID=UPI000262B73D|nr:Arm DNA-binding domain-containing protein [Sphingobium yanoikuyae]